MSPLPMVKDCFCQLCPYLSSPPRPWHVASVRCLPGPRSWVRSVVPIWMLVLGRCSETLIPTCESIFQSHSEVTESSQSLRSLRHNLNVFKSPSKITASIFSDQVIFCLLTKSMFCNTHPFSVKLNEVKVLQHECPHLD